MITKRYRKSGVSRGDCNSWKDSNKMANARKFPLSYKVVRTNLQPLTNRGDISLKALLSKAVDIDKHVDIVDKVPIYYKDILDIKAKDQKSYTEWQ
jgi:hypothetical protein